MNALPKSLSHLRGLLRVGVLPVALGSVLATLLVLPGGSASAAARGPNANQVTICHTGSGKKWVENHPAKTADAGGHAYLFDAVKNSWQGHEDDIIPPFSYPGPPAGTFPGQNWDAAGQLIYDNGCSTLDATATAPAPVSVSACSGGSATVPSYTVPTTTGVTYLVNGNPVVSGSVRTGFSSSETLTAQPENAAYVLTNPSFSVTITFGALATGCGLPTNVTADPAVLVPSSCLNGAATQPSYVVPTVGGVQYKVNGSPVLSGSTRSGVGISETLTAEPASAAFALTNPTFTQTVTFGALTTGCVRVTAVAPAVTPSVCANNAPTQPSYVVPTTTGVQYKVGGTPVLSGSVRSGVGTAETLTAEPASTVYSLTNPAFAATLTLGALATGCAPFIPQTPAPVLTPDLGITKVGPTSAVKPGDDISYVLTVTNTGTGSASGVQITDTLPGALAFVSATGSGFTCSGTVSITCQLAGPLASGASATVSLVVRLAADYTATAVANAATVLPTDANPGNNTDSETTAVVLPVPAVDEDLGLSKEGLSESVAPGGILSWTVTVTNVQGTPAAGFTVVDTLPAGLTLVTVGADGWACSSVGQVVTCTYTATPLPVGSSSAFQLDALVDASYQPARVVNSAVVDPGGVNSDNDTATATTDVVREITGGGGGGAVAPEPVAPPEEPAPVLPFSGTYTDKALLAGVAFLLAGLMLALAGRRRRTT